MIPDPIESAEAQCEAWALENVDANGIAVCSCGRTFPLEHGQTLTPNPYAIPVCPVCFQEACLNA